jgi:hypothetical protein
MTAEPNAWVEREAHRLAPLLEGEHAVVISGPDPVASAAVALALAHVHGATRRVAIADLVGDVAPLVQAVHSEADDDPHGIADSFLYGVSLNKIARPLDPTGSMFVMPSGTEPVATDAIYGNERWRRLAAGFQQVGALLLVVAVREAPGFEMLCQQVGALLPVGVRTMPVLDQVRVLWIAPAPPPPDEVRRVERAMSVAAEDEGQRRGRLLAVLLIAAAITLALVWSWPTLQTRFFSGAGWLATPGAFAASGDPDGVRTVVAAVTRTAGSASSATPAVRRSAGDQMVVAAAPSPAPDELERARRRGGALVVANPADSTSASQFAVYFVNANTIEQAQPPASVATLGAVAISPVLDGVNNARWYRVTVGAGTDSLQAVALLSRLRTAGDVGPSSGSIMRLPYAFRLANGLMLDALPAQLARWTQRGIRAYALRQRDGTITLYTGAFQTPAQATLLADSLQQAGIPPMLVYRTGRTF